ncbi:tyrosine-type recombinase/integrase [Burkholderia gladioli]|uniref:tyrosine-type recombinase/integrase n=1 Tax=Burkholderia gladioli TaxID=28095 RepID=UPI003F78F65B
MPHPLPGAAGTPAATSRAALFPYIAAPHDLVAVRAYLYQYRYQPKTLRAYTKELERFLPSAGTVRRVPLSGVLVDDCEAYKDFLQTPAADFVGARAPRHSPRWRPFANGQLSGATPCARCAPRSPGWCRCAISPATRGRPSRIRSWTRGSAACRSNALWRRIRGHATRQAHQMHDGATGLAAAQWRVALAAMLLMAESGLRREELAGAERAALRISPHALPGQPVWQMTIVGKRREERTVPARMALAELSPHTFRHTFGMQAVASEVPLDVVQKVLGHASLQTTSIYVQAEQQPIMQEAGR